MKNTQRLDRLVRRVVSVWHLFALTYIMCYSS